MSSTSYKPISHSSDITFDDRHIGCMNVLDNAAGLTVTLPDATGSGKKFQAMVKTTVTSNNITIQAANADDVMSGNALVAADGGNTVLGFETAADSDTITLNGSTTGGIKGDRITVEDIADNLWSVSLVLSATGTEATPFSAAVS